ncbi:MAG TPA: sulfurtransferase [Luteimonas sp.]|nr:sulfurtransferase [Luteimonas sp.]
MNGIDWRTLVEAGQLAPALGSAPLVVVDVRASLSDDGAGRRAYTEAHLPGAIHLRLHDQLSGPHVPGAGRHPWPSDAAFARVLGDCGLTPRHQLVAYDDGDGAFAARLWFLLQAFGHARAAVLDGGWQGWLEAGRPVTALPPRVDPAPAYPGTFDRARLLDADGLDQALSAGAMLLDARAGPRFRGEVEPIDAVAGHIPGAVNRPYAENLRGGRFKLAVELATEFERLLAGQPASELVASCGSGVTACHHLLAMAHAGLDGGRLYTGSWSGWIEDPLRPIVSGVGAATGSATPTDG